MIKTIPKMNLNDAYPFINPTSFIFPSGLEYKLFYDNAQTYGSAKLSIAQRISPKYYQVIYRCKPPNVHGNFREKFEFGVSIREQGWARVYTPLSLKDIALDEKGIYHINKEGSDTIKLECLTPVVHIVNGTALAPKNELLKNDLLNIMDSSFNRIGGYDAIKRELLIEAYLFRTNKYFQYGLSPTTGILLVGPTGTGKTLFAEAFMDEATRFLDNPSQHKVRQSVSDLDSKWCGESSKNVSNLYEEARKKQPYVIFFDEADSLLGKRVGVMSSADTHHNSLTNQFLQELSDVEKRGYRILTLIASNHSQNIDPAMLRYGRISKHYEIGLPDEQGRKEIFSHHLSENGRQDLLARISCKDLARQSLGYSGADIAGIVDSVFKDRLQRIFFHDKVRKVAMKDLMAKIEERNENMVKTGVPNTIRESLSLCDGVESTSENLPN